MIVQTMSCVIMSKMWYIKHCYVDCRKSIYTLILVHGQGTIIFAVSVCLFVQSFSQPSLIQFRSN